LGRKRKKVGGERAGYSFCAVAKNQKKEGGKREEGVVEIVSEDT